MDFFLFGRVVRPDWPYMRFLFVGPKLCPRWHFSAFASGFLQIPPHGGHPCLWLTVPATESVVDFHHQVIAHAGRTKNAANLDFEVSCIIHKQRIAPNTICKNGLFFRNSLGSWSLNKPIPEHPFLRRCLETPTVFPINAKSKQLNRFQPFSNRMSQ